MRALSSAHSETVVASIRWPLPYEHEPNRFEIVGRYIAQVLIMERFIDIVLLDLGASPRKLRRSKLATKIGELRAHIGNPDLELQEWHDLPDVLTRVARHRNLFAHRMFERNLVPTHYAQGIEYVQLSDEELRDQEWEAFFASEVCRQLAERTGLGTLNPGMHFGRTDPKRAEVSTPDPATRRETAEG
jgi:hypothetical protein